MINRISHWLNETDKQQHIMASCVIMLISLLFMAVMPSFILTFAIGIAKEIWDKYYGSGFCWYDILANSLGIVLAIVLDQIIN